MSDQLDSFDITMRIARNLSRARKAKGLSQAQVADRVNAIRAANGFSATLRRNEIRRWEHAIVRPSDDYLLPLACVLEQDYAWFFMEHSDPVMEPVA